MSQSPVSLVHSKLGKSPSGAHLSQYACATIKHKQTSTTGFLSKEQDFVLMTQEVWNSKVKKLAGFVSGEVPLSIFTLMAMHCYLAHRRGRRLYSRLACKKQKQNWAEHFNTKWSPFPKGPPYSQTFWPRSTS